MKLGWFLESILKHNGLEGRRRRVTMASTIRVSEVEEPQAEVAVNSDIVLRSYWPDAFQQA